MVLGGRKIGTAKTLTIENCNRDKTQNHIIRDGLRTKDSLTEKSERCSRSKSLPLISGYSIPKRRHSLRNLFWSRRLIHKSTSQSLTHSGIADGKHHSFIDCLSPSLKRTCCGSSSHDRDAYVWKEPELIPLSILDEDVVDFQCKQKRYDHHQIECLSMIRENSDPEENFNIESRRNTFKHLYSAEVNSVVNQVIRGDIKRTSLTQDTSTIRFHKNRSDTEGKRKSIIDASLSKAKLTQLLKTTQLEQLSKLQSKHTQECDLLDDIRNFGKQRSQIEREYGQALQKLVQQYNKKEWPAASDEGGNHTTVMSVWRSVLEATDKTAQTRINSSENYKNGIYEAAKNTRTQKDNNLKKCTDLLNTLQNEITETVKDLTKTKKKYYELEQLAESAREKFKEIDDRRKRNQTGIFKSKAGLERTFQKLEQKCEECDKNATIARNEYLLTLAAANVHQKRYYEVDMPECMRILDGDIFTKLQDYLSSLNRYELEACGTTQEAFTLSLQRSTMISREFSTRCFLKENPVFEWGPKYEYEACDDDPNKGALSAEQGAAGDDNSLNREARKWAGRYVRENKQLQKLTRQKQALENIRGKYTENPELTTDQNIAETEIRLEKCIEDGRRIETNHLKSQARLDLLRTTTVNVDSWIQSAINQAAKEPNNSIPSTPVDPNKSILNQNNEFPQNTNGALLSFTGDDSSFIDDDFDDTFDEAFDDDDPINSGYPDDDVSLSASEHSRSYPVSCKVLYGYEGTRTDELTIKPGDVIEVVEDGDLEQWVKARDQNGQIGYVPEKYLEFPPPSNNNSLNHHSTSSSIYEKSPSIVSSTSGNIYGGSLHADGTLSCISGSSCTSGTSSLTTSSLSSAVNQEDAEVESHTSGGLVFAKAIYEYEGCNSDELSFPEGAIIRIISKDENGVDDGWWKGELNGKTGVFPALVVEELEKENKVSPVPQQRKKAWTINEHTLDSPTMDLPPSFHPLPPAFNLNPPSPMARSSSYQNVSSSSLPTTPTKQSRPTRLAPPPPQRPRSVTSRIT